MGFKEEGQAVVSILNKYYEDSIKRKKNVLDQKPLRDIVLNLKLAQLCEAGGLEGKALEEFFTSYLEYTNHLHHPGYMGHQVAVPAHTGSFGSFVDGFTNNAMAVYEMGPAAAAVEYFMINYLLAKIGWETMPYDLSQWARYPHSGGIFTHGGSLANLTAFIAARNMVQEDVWTEGNRQSLAALVSPSCHYSVTRAAGIVGIGEKNLCFLETDEYQRILPEKLPGALEKMKKEGKNPFILVGSACGTALGLYDDLSFLGDFCKSEGIPFHVDGAHGTSVLFSSKYKHLVDGIEKADTITWDAHKMLRTPTLCAALLTKDSRSLLKAFKQKGSYIFHEKEQPGIDFIHQTVECTKAGLGLKFFTSLAGLGDQGMSDYLDRTYDLSRQAYHYVNTLDDFETVIEPESNIFVFRLKGPDPLQLEIRKKLLREGDFYITTTEFNGKWYLRTVFMNPDTTIDDFIRLIDQVRRFRK